VASAIEEAAPQGSHPAPYPFLMPLQMNGPSHRECISTVDEIGSDDCIRLNASIPFTGWLLPTVIDFLDTKSAIV
jgi:hypothetical protein